MENEDLDLDFDSIEANSEKKLQAKNRFQDLSDKVKTTAQERDALNAKLKAEAEAKTKLEKERDFFRDFSKVSSQYPSAAEYQDKILEKVNSGYSTEDATLAILAKEGKLGGTTVQPIVQQTASPAGGSSSTQIGDNLEKSPNEMTREELRNALLQAEKEGVNLLKT